MVNKTSPLPATLILGFAGSGKTSLIQHLSNQTRTAVEHIQSGSSELGSGCICCSKHKNLKQLIKDLTFPVKSWNIEITKISDFKSVVNKLVLMRISQERIDFWNRDIANDKPGRHGRRHRSIKEITGKVRSQIYAQLL